MAELALKIGSTATYDDGDILCAFNERRIHCVHAEHICWPRIAGKKVGGQLEATQPLLEKMYLRTAQYKWERVSKTEMTRTNLLTLAEVTYGSTPIEDPDRPGHMIHCNVDEYFQRRIAASKLPLFGVAGSEIMYGGRTKKDAVTVEALWDDIENDTALRRVDHGRWPVGTLDLKTNLFLAVDEFDDVEANELVVPLLDEASAEEEKPVLKKRKHHVDWETATAASLSASKADIQNMALSVDMREESTFDRASVVLTKVAK